MKETQDIQRVMDHMRIVEQVPGRDENRGDCGDHAAHAPADQLRRHVGKIESRRHEVGDDIDADRGDHESQAAQHHRKSVVDMAHHLHRIGNQLAVQRQGGSDADYRQQREAEEIDRQSPEISRLLIGNPCRKAKIAEVEHRPREIGNYQRGGIFDHDRNRRRATAF